MRFVIAGIALTGIALAAGLADACSCAPNPPAKQALEKSGAVFTAKVVKMNDEAGGAGIRREVTLEVIRVWKGVTAKSLTVSTAKSGAACGYGFQEGKSYIVYAHKGDGEKLFVSLCSRTAPLERAQGDVKELGEGKAPAGN